MVEKGSETMDVRNKDEVILRMKAVVASKQYGQEDILCPLIADVLVFSFLIKRVSFIRSSYNDD